MKRLHIHVNTAKSTFDPTTQYYTDLFGLPPTTTRANYAKWMLDDPRVNFVVEVIEVAGDTPGIHHLGIQTEDVEELEGIRQAMKGADHPLLEVGDTVCCYMTSQKHWTMDPNGIKWEAFRSVGAAPTYGAKTEAELAHYTDSDTTMA